MAKLIRHDFGGIHDALNKMIIAETKAALMELPGKCLETDDRVPLCRVVVSSRFDYNPCDLSVRRVWLNGEGELCFSEYTKEEDGDDTYTFDEDDDLLDITDFDYLIDQIAEQVEGDKAVDLKETCGTSPGMSLKAAIDKMNKEQTIKYLIDLMATVQMAHFKGREVGVRVEEIGDLHPAAINIDLYDFGGTGDDLIDGLHGVTPYHGEDTESETGWVFNIGYDPDDEEPLYFLFLPDGADDAYTILPTTLPEDLLQRIAAWLEKVMVPAKPTAEVTKAKDIIALWSDWCMDWDDENLWLDYMVKHPKGHCNRQHLQEKWDYCYEKYGSKAAMTMFWRELDNGNRAILVEYVTTQWHKTN